MLNHEFINDNCLEEKKTFYLETSAFLTGVNIVEKGPKKLDYLVPKADEINSSHSKLNDLITVSFNIYS